MFRMLTKQDRSYIDNLLDKRFDDFEIKMDAKFEALAIMIQNGFDEINRNKADKADVDRIEIKLGNKMDKLEGRMNTLEFKLITAPSNRLDKVEDDVRQIKAKIGIA